VRCRSTWRNASSGREVRQSRAPHLAYPHPLSASDIDGNGALLHISMYSTYYKIPCNTPVLCAPAYISTVRPCIPKRLTGLCVDCAYSIHTFPRGSQHAPSSVPEPLL
jgi:hypothetical protein